MNKKELNPVRLGLHMAAFAAVVLISMLAAAGNDIVVLIAAGAAFAAPLLDAKDLWRQAYVVAILGGFAAYVGGGWWCLAIFAIACIAARYSVNYGAVAEVEE